MTSMSAVIAIDAVRRTARGVCALLAVGAALTVAGCATTGHPPPIARGELAEGKTFPYYVLYWVGPHFEGRPLAAADRLPGANDTVGDSGYYGDCVQSKGIFGGGSCLLPLQVTTVVYRSHSNSPLGPQRHPLLRGVPATESD